MTSAAGQHEAAYDTVLDSPTLCQAVAVNRRAYGLILMVYGSVAVRDTGKLNSAVAEFVTAELGVSIAQLISWDCQAGMLFVIPGSEDARCGELQVDNCECRFVAGPHPDLAELK